MIVASYVNVKPDMAHSRTYEDFYKFLGTRPKMMGVMARMNTHNTATFLTEALMNIYYNSKTANKFQPINSLVIEWEIDVEFIKRIEFAAAPVGDGASGSDILMYFKERYYERFDTFKIDGSRQQAIVKVTPERKADNFWEYTVQLIDADYSSILDSASCQLGMTTRFLANIMPEYHEEGFTKYQSNIEKHRQWITEHRNDISYSSRYAQMEDQFIKIAQGENTGEMKEKIFKLNKMEKDLLDSFQIVKNNALLWQKTTMDANGKSTVLTDDGRPLVAGDGLIPQIERFASKYKFAKLNVNVINTVMEQMNQKAVQATGNNYTFIVNDRLWGQINTVLGDWLKLWGSTPTMLYSKATQGMVKADNPMKVGATFVSYEISGNTVNFMVDRALSKEYDKKAYGICLDMTPDMSTNQPAIAAFTLQGAEFVTSKYPGVGGIDGITSGIVSSPVAGSKLIVAGYSGIAAFAPYKSFIIEEV
ncbi:MAG: hypothetical protein ACOH2V_00115 [Candidatus Saccharimonadaceae bacterium]